ncbi:MAG: 6-carboxytetrahydropterin synthase QueD [Leptospiraceae bacterium]|nr:6-carboxytetrahydropterin synthase QueD [Leptospiraceae bacterium]MCB1167795.1 6-carboxytetrahydropterin synthase QueD [Leptospiraceae bacterium]
MSQEVEIVKKYRFEAAHFLPNVPEGHKCKRMHGHSFKFELLLRGPVQADTGWLIDFGDISKVVKPLIENYLDHYLLNDIEGLENPTSEQISIWLWNRIKPHLPALAEIIVHETCTARCIYRGA